MNTKSLIILILATIWGCKLKTTTDMIIKNARIYSVNESFEIFESMVVNGGRIIALGTEQEILSKYNSDLVLDMNGKYVYPGFIDPHCHFFGYGTSLREADLTGTRSFEEVLSRLKTHAKKQREGWITGMGWDQNDWEIKEFPEKAKKCMAKTQNH